MTSDKFPTQKYPKQTQYNSGLSSSSPLTALANTSDAKYNRLLDLPRLIAVWPNDLNNLSKQSLFSIVGKLRHALRAERQKGKAGHWAYDMNRHLALLHAYKAECKALQNFEK